ncbi:hypothetical protein [Kordiimonas marina]|uniref:hypothetical protein n=1 Tax=Kordiimonas marina TaxID=2872312 RepID=UPI001FF383A9|nr:hypothetical protein [Kordiimonas marina]MCJ9430508.1 hypothetical protein [Kordiimonas marina]
MSSEKELLEIVGRNWADDARKYSEFYDLLRSYLEDSDTPDQTIFETLAKRVAIAYHDQKIGYEQGDSIMNYLWLECLSEMTKGHLEDIPPVLMEMYEAFDAGEFYRTDDQSDDPVKEHTDPAIARFVEGLEVASKR